MEPRYLLSASYSLSPVVSFDGSTSGYTPNALIADSQGNLFGATGSGGTNNLGTIFEIAAGGNSVTVLANFSSSTGGVPLGALTFDAQGNLYGVTTTGGPNGSNAGTIFELPSGSNAVSVLAPFTSNSGVSPAGGMVRDTQGNLFGFTTSGGGGNLGAAYKLATGSNTITQLASFNSGGYSVVGAPLIDSGGNLFGAASRGGTNNLGSVFEISLGSSSVTVLASLGQYTTGYTLSGGLVRDSQGNFYGATQRGGANNLGAIFEVDATTHTTTLLASLVQATGYSSGGTLLLDSQGNLFGTAARGAANNLGGVFELRAGAGVTTLLASFVQASGYPQSFVPFGVPTDGNLLMDARGNLFGSNSRGGANNLGTIYELALPQPTQLVITQQPASASAGQSLGTIEVDVEDANGNLSLYDNSLITLTSSATLVGATSVHAVNGVATFTNVSITHLGSATLTASDGSLTPATSNSFTITPAAAAKLVFTQQPTSPAPGHNVVSMRVSIEDAYGNVVATNHSTVTLTAVEGAPLSGTTSVAAVNGVATFSDLLITRSGTHTLSTSDGSLTPAVSAAITIAPTLAALVITTPATTVASGGTLQLSVGGLDGIGAPITPGAVTWSLDAGSSGTIDQNGLFTAGSVAGDAVARATSNGITTTAAISVTALAPVITVNAYAQMVSNSSNTGTLHVQSEVAGTSAADLIYTWSIVSQPASVSAHPRIVGTASASAAPLVRFSINGTNAASNTAVTFLASGAYTLQVVATDGTQSVTQQVNVTAHVDAAAPQTPDQRTQVSGVSAVGDGAAITGFVITFNGPLDPATAQDVRGYRILRPYTAVGGGFFQTLFGQSNSHNQYAKYPVESAVYDAQTNSVAITLSRPMPTTTGTRVLQVFAAGPHAVRDARGKAIQGNSGSAFTYRIRTHVGKTMRYTTARGDAVTLSLAGPGRIVTLRPAGSDMPVIFLRGTDPAASTLTGRIRKGRKSLGYVVVSELNDTARADVRLGEAFQIHVRNTGGAPA